MAMADSEDLRSEHILQDLAQKAELLLKLFDLLPGEQQMNGLDVFQNVVNGAVSRITKGRVKSIRFVPVEIEEDAEEGELENSEYEDTSLIEIKQEPEDIKDDYSVALDGIPLYECDDSVEEADGELASVTDTDNASEGGEVIGTFTSGELQPLGFGKKPLSQEKTQLLKKVIAKTKKTKAAPGPMRYNCPKCPYKTNKKSHLEIHLLAHDPSKNFSCDECGKKFTAASSLKRHKMAHEGIKPHICPICSKSFVDLASLRTHAVVHTGEKLFQCDQCPKQYTNSANLSRHKRVHTGAMPYECKECGVRYRDMSSLKLHHLKHTGEKPYLCDVCHKQFKTSSDFRRHERTHTGERNYACKQCGRTFIQGWHLKQHERMHTDYRPFSCSICNQRFRTKSGLQHHLRSHAGIKDHQCGICQKKFSTKKYLENHQVVHSQAKPFKCQYCGADFNQYSNLKRHEKIHSEERRYKCRYCEKAFKYINSWRYHEGIHTGELLSCDACAIQVRSINGLKKHKCDPSKYEENKKKAQQRPYKPKNGLLLVPKEKVQPEPKYKGLLQQKGIFETKIKVEDDDSMELDTPSVPIPLPKLKKTVKSRKVSGKKMLLKVKVPQSKPGSKKKTKKILTSVISSMNKEGADSCELGSNGIGIDEVPVSQLLPQIKEEKLDKVFTLMEMGNEEVKIPPLPAGKHKLNGGDQFSSVVDDEVIKCESPDLAAEIQDDISAMKSAYVMLNSELAHCS